MLAICPILNPDMKMRAGIHTCTLILGTHGSWAAMGSKLYRKRTKHENCFFKKKIFLPSKWVMQIHYAHPANDVHQRRIWMIPHKKGRLLATYHARCKPRERCGQFRQWWCRGGRHGQQGQALHDRAGTKLRSQLVTKLQANFQPLNHCQPLFLEVNICQRNDNVSNIDTDIYTLHIIQIFISLNFLQTLFRYLIIIFMMHKNHLNLNLNFEFIFEFLVFWEFGQIQPIAHPTKEEIILGSLKRFMSEKGLGIICEQGLGYTLVKSNVWVWCFRPI